MPHTDQTAHDVLVVLDPVLAEDAVAALGGMVTVTHRLPPRLARVGGEVSTDRALAIPGVVSVHHHPPVAVPGEATLAERAFISAWQTTQEPGTRLGEGLDWDAAGFSPPDQPQGLHPDSQTN